MARYYAQIDAGRVVAVTEAAGEINRPDMVLLSSFEPQIVGYSYSSGVFTAPLPGAAVVTKRQAREALIDAGLLSTAEAALGAIADPVARAKALNNWEHAQTFERDHPLVLALGPALGLDSAGLDALFAAAAIL